MRLYHCFRRSYLTTLPSAHRQRRNEQITHYSLLLIEISSTSNAVLVSSTRCCTATITASSIPRSVMDGHLLSQLSIERKAVAHPSHTHLLAGYSAPIDDCYLNAALLHPFLTVLLLRCLLSHRIYSPFSNRLSMSSHLLLNQQYKLVIVHSLLKSN